MKKKEFWEDFWSRKYERYNRTHMLPWDGLRPYLKEKIADLGCGPCMLYKNLDVDLTGVDFSEKAIEEARKNYPQGKFVLADVCDTGLPKNYFDIIILSGILQYFDDWSDVITEAKRIKKPEGKIFATYLMRKVGKWLIFKIE